MSKQIDEKVVSMKFDNKQFESNVSTTMSTLDKLKAKLNFSGASKGLEQINTAANKVDMKGMSNAIDTVQMKLSAMQVIGVTALANITNQAVEAGKKLVSSLTVAPVMDGFKEYELTMNTIQTIMNSTGATAENVKEQLKELDEYADKTVYSTADMFNNIYKFTNAGIDLDTAKVAMIGIANATADAGQGAREASMAYYNLAQSIGTGFLTTIDYKSLNLANIMTQDLKQAFADAAIEAGTLTKVGENLYSTGKKTYNLQQLFNDALSDQWATTDVMMDVFSQYGDETTELGKRAWDAATKVKTFTGMMEALKASAGTGWKTTWELLFGDLDEATALWTGLYKFISGIIDGMNNFRNGVLESGLGKSFKGLVDTFNTASKPIKETADAISTVTKTAEDYAKVVDQIIRGDFKNAPERYQLLTEAGYDWAHAQNLVNEKLGSSVRHSTNYTEAQTQVVSAQKEVADNTSDLIAELAEMSDEQLRQKGYTEEQIKALNELAKMAKKTGIPLKEFIENIDQINGRWLLLESFKNIGNTLAGVFKSFGDAWNETFFGTTDSATIISKLGDALFNLIAAFHKFSRIIMADQKSLNNLKDTFKGLFSILKLVLTIVGGPIKIAFNILGQLFKALDVSGAGLLEITGALGRGLSSFVDSINGLFDLSAIFERLAPSIQEAGKALKNWFSGIKEADNIGLYIIQGLINGLKSAVKGVVTFFTEIGRTIIDTICKVLGIHSPSTEFFTIGQNIIQGLVNGLQNGFSWVWNTISSLGKGIIEFIKAIDIGRVVALVIGAGLIAAAVKLSNSMLNLANGVVAPLVGLENLLNDLGDAAGNLAKGVKFKMIAEGIKSIAIAIGILAISLIALSRLSWEEIGKALVTLGALALGLTALTFALSKMSFKGLNSKGIGKLSLTLLSLSVVLVIVSQAMKNVGNMDVGQLTKAIIGLIAMVAALTLLMKAIGKFVNGKDLKNISKIGTMIRKVSISLLLLVGVMKLASMLKAEEVLSGTLVMGLFYAFIVSLMKITKVAKASDADKLGKMIRKVSTSLLIMIAVMKLASMLKAEEVIKGIAFMTAMGIFMSALMVVSKFGGENAAKLGVMMIGLSVSLLLMVGVCKLIGMMSVEEITKGIVAIGAFSLFMSLLMAVNKNGKGAVKLGAMLIMVAGAMAILAGVIFIIGQFKPSEIAKGLVVIGILTTFFAGLMYMSQFTSDASIGALKKMTIILVLLTAAVALLSFIDTKKALTATAGLSAVMFAFASMLAATGKVKVTKGVMRNVTIMTLIVALLAGVIAALSLLPNSSSIIPIAGSLAGLMAAMSLVLVILSNTCLLYTSDAADEL